MPKFAMSDARAFTDYNPNCELNKMIQEKYKITNSHAYRQFLQKNADKIIEANSKIDEDTNCKFCPVCKTAIEYNPNKV